VAGSGKKSKRIKNTIGDVSQIAALLGQSSGYMSPQQAAATQAIGSLIQGSGPSDLTGDVFYPPEGILPPKPRGARPRIAVDGGAHPQKKKTVRSPISHRDVMKTYNSIVSMIERKMGKSTTTDNIELEQMGHALLGTKFKGVYASNGIPALTVKQPCAVINNKPAPGEHWLGVARVPRTGRVMVYDSFGRSHAKLLPGALPPGTQDTDPDVDQSVKQTNCGQRPLAWLVVFGRLGPAAARLV